MLLFTFCTAGENEFFQDHCWLCSGEREVLPEMKKYWDLDEEEA